jgi:hypothetical protein
MRLVVHWPVKVVCEDGVDVTTTCRYADRGDPQEISVI